MNASRTHVNGTPDAVVRLSADNVNDCAVGDTLDTVRRYNGQVCDWWTLQAILTDGPISAGTIRESLTSYRVNYLG